MSALPCLGWWKFLSCEELRAYSVVMNRRRMVGQHAFSGFEFFMLGYLFYWVVAICSVLWSDLCFLVT